MAVVGTEEEAKGIRVGWPPDPQALPAQAQSPKDTVRGCPAHPWIPEASLVQQLQDFFSD